MPFAGHPMVGTAFVLASQHPNLNSAAFEVPARVVQVRIERDADGAQVGASVDTPQPLGTGETVAPEVIARVLQLKPEDVVTTHHAPIAASNGNPFVIVELAGDALSRCDPDLAAFRTALAAHPQFGSRFSVHV